MWLCGKKIVLKIPPRIYLLNFCHLLRLSYIGSDRKSWLTLYLQNIKSFHVIFVFFAQFLKLILKTPTISDIFLLVTTCQKLVRWSQIKRWKYRKYEKVNTLHWWRFLYNYERYFWWRRESEWYKLFLHHAKEKQYCFWI